METSRNQVISLLRARALNDYGNAFELFFSHYHERMVQFAQLFVHTRCHAEDTVSDVVIRLFRKGTPLFLLENFEAYLFRSVKNEAINKLRSERLAAVYRETNQGETSHDRIDPHEKFLEHELSGHIDDVIDKFPPRRQQVYRLIKHEGLRYKDVAQMLEISERTVEVHLKIAIRELRGAIGLYLNDEARQCRIDNMNSVR